MALYCAAAAASPASSALASASASAAPNLLAPPSASAQLIPASLRLNAIACRTATVCEAVGDSLSQAVVVPIINGVPGAPHAVPGVTFLNGVACPSATSCEAVGIGQPGQGVAVTITDGIPGTAHAVPNTFALFAVSCPTVTSCEAAGNVDFNFDGPFGHGVVVAITNGIPGAVHVVTDTAVLGGVACANAGNCDAVGNNLFNYNGSGGGVLVPITNGTPDATQFVTGTDSINTVTCPSATTCEAVGSNSTSLSVRGAVVTITNGVPGAPRVVADGLSAVGCSSATSCEAVGGRTVPGTSTQLGEAVSITGGVPGVPQLIAGPGSLKGVACPTASTCEAVGQSQLSDHSSQGMVAAITLAAPARYQPLIPKRICDTRAPAPAVAANQCDIHGHNALTAGGVLTVTVAGKAGVPADATAVVLHVTATATSASSYLTVWPTGQARPATSDLNWAASRTVPNLVQSAVGAGGQVSFFNAAGSSDVVVDLEGYFGPTAGGSFFPVVPTRICDSRAGQPRNQCNRAGAVGGPLGRGQTRIVNVETGFGVPSGATAVALSVTATTTSAAGFLDIWPDGTTAPFASSLSWAAGQTISNRVITPVSPTGNIDLFNAYGTTDVVIDLGGYYSTGAAGSSYVPISPFRICDTRPIRPGTASDLCNSGGVGPAGSRHSMTLSGFDPDVTAVVANMTVTNTAGAGFATVYPARSSPVPLAADITWSPRQTIGNLIVADLASNSALAVFNGSNASIDVVIDVVGYYISAPAG